LGKIVDSTNIVVVSELQVAPIDELISEGRLFVRGKSGVVVEPVIAVSIVFGALKSTRYEGNTREARRHEDIDRLVCISRVAGESPHQGKSSTSPALSPAPIESAAGERHHLAHLIFETRRRSVVGVGKGRLESG